MQESNVLLNGLISKNKYKMDITECPEQDNIEATMEECIDRDANIAVESKSLLDQSYPDFVEKYFSRINCNEIRGPADDYSVLVHSNRVCLVTLADTHKLMQPDKIPIKVDFQISDKINREDNPMTGKGKRGAQQLCNNSILCHVTCQDGSCIPVHAAVAGKLLEINQSLVQNPAAVKETYIAIVLPSIPTFESFEIPLKNEDGFFDEDCDS
uniref:Protein Simiate n=1 Tax=Cacopsylla melanoneura TaxID=428564 RepID=A0A8D8RA57_9HEMI